MECKFCGEPDASNNLSVVLDGKTLGGVTICKTCANVASADGFADYISEGLFDDADRFAWCEHCHTCPAEEGCEHQPTLACPYVRKHYHTEAEK
jgi:hypothetical protein